MTWAIKYMKVMSNLKIPIESSFWHNWGNKIPNSSRYFFAGNWGTLASSSGHRDANSAKKWHWYTHQILLFALYELAVVRRKQVCDSVASTGLRTTNSNANELNWLSSDLSSAIFEQFRPQDYRTFAQGGGLKYMTYDKCTKIMDRPYFFHINRPSRTQEFLSRRTRHRSGY